jgi:hypothetical protein
MIVERNWDPFCSQVGSNPVHRLSGNGINVIVCVYFELAFLRGTIPNCLLSYPTPSNLFRPHHKNLKIFRFLWWRRRRTARPRPRCFQSASYSHKFLAGSRTRTDILWLEARDNSLYTIPALSSYLYTRLRKLIREGLSLGEDITSLAIPVVVVILGIRKPPLGSCFIRSTRLHDQLHRGFISLTL